MTTDAHAGLTHRALDPTSDGPDAERVRGWIQSLARVFHDGRPSDEQVRVWLENVGKDGMRLSGYWPDHTAVASRHVPVATYTSWTGSDLNVGDGRTLPLHMITDVTVSPTHRRRGLLTSMMVADLREAAERGLPLAVLTATEATIYGRFGFGQATRLRSLEVDVTARFALRPYDDEGSVDELVEPAEAWPTLAALQARRRDLTRGAMDWPAFYEAFMSGTFSWDEGGPDRKLRMALHLDAAGQPDGFVTWRHKGEPEGRPTIELGELWCAAPAGELALWDFVAGIDLVDQVRWGRAPMSTTFEWALLDSRVVRTTRVRDLLWLRVLDVVAALEARPWYADGALVLGIDDAVGIVDGSWAVEVVDGRATVTRSDATPAVTMPADTLGALYLGGVDVATLAAAGRLAGSPDAIARLGDLMDGGPTPYCTTGF